MVLETAKFAQIRYMKLFIPYYVTMHPSKNTLILGSVCIQQICDKSLKFNE